MKRILGGLLAAVLLATTANCYGGFVATRKIYAWNGGLGNKWVRTIVMWIFLIIPVYPVAALVDFVVLNTLEFWTGSNPLAMKEGESETQLVELRGKKYLVTASKNQFAIREVGKDGDPVLLQFEPSEAAWYLRANGHSIKISEAEDLAAGEVRLFHPDGQSVVVRL